MTPQQWAMLFACAAVIAIVTAVLAWQCRARTPAATALAVTMIGVATWSGADALLHGVGSDLVRRAYPPVLMASVGVAVVGLYAVARTVSDPSWRPAGRGVALLAVEPVVMVVLAALPATRELVMSGHAMAEKRVAFGAAFAVHSLYSYVVVGLAYLHLVRRWKTSAGVFRRQVGVLLAAGMVSSVGNVVAIAAHARGVQIDITPLFFLATGLVDCWALLRLGLLRLVPVARDQVVDTVPDAVLVVDPHEVLIDINPAARRMLRRLRPELGDRELVGRPLPEIAGERALAALERTERRDGQRIAEVVPGLWLDIRDTPVGDPRGRPLGRILVVRDVSEQQARQEAVETLNRQLAEQVRVIDRLRAELAEEAVRDPLTGLHNRRHLDQVLPADLDRRPRAGELAILALDIDHFKSVNDRFGHGAGDQVLAAVARLLQAAVRDGDTAVRLGGEEFLLVLPGAGRDQAMARAEQVRRDVAAAVHLLDGEAVRVTVSAGIAVCPDDGGTAAALLATADRALYTAKATGRNRVVAADTLLRGMVLAAPAMSEPVPGG